LRQGRRKKDEREREYEWSHLSYMERKTDTNMCVSFVILKEEVVSRGYCWS
jgi:hypothetical protein